jgi:hypothetical protein
LHYSVQQILATWAHNRRVYPGWLAIPSGKRELISWNTRSWVPSILRVLSEFTLVDQLSAIRELLWRWEHLLEPVHFDVEVVAQNILNEIDCHTRSIGSIANQSAPWPNIRESWREVTLSLVTAARHRFDSNAFDQRLEALQPFINDHPDVAQRVYHERCLWALYALNFGALDELLKEWHTKDVDPAWMMRKGAILVEADRNDDAVRLFNRALSSVRKAPKAGRSLAGPSREGWALWLALAFDKSIINPTEKTLQAPPAFPRWQQLASLTARFESAASPI